MAGWSDPGADPADEWDNPSGNVPDLFSGVEMFMRAAGQDVADRPALPELGPVRRLRRELLREEFTEYRAAELSEDFPEIVDGLIDVIVIAYGTLLTYAGRDATRACMAEVTRSNLDKIVDGQVTRRDDGKILKPEGWTGPRIAEVLEAAR